MVAKGYDQIPGINFKYNFAPVTSDVTLRTLLVIWVAMDYHAETSDVQTAFLYGDLKESIYIHKPDGWDLFAKENDFGETKRYLKLNKSIYGLVQAA